MKYLIIDVKNGDQFEQVFNTKDEAIKYANVEWNTLTLHDRKQREAYYVLEVENVDDLCGNVVKEYMI